MLHAPPVVDLRPYADTVTFEFPGGSFQQTSIYLAAWGAPLRLVAAPANCGETFSKRVVEGIDRGWDVILPSDFFAPNGTYTLRATRTEGDGAFRFPLRATGLLGR